MPLDFSNYETKPDVFSLEGLIDWLELQSGETEYCWGNYKNCLFHDFMVAHGEPAGFERACDFFDPRDRGHISMKYPRTYAAALTRARELIAERVDE